jgi:hypothetical protein
MKSAETETVAEAVGFLSSRVVEEARKDSIPLTDIELKQLSFTKETATAEEVAGAREFDETNDTDEFEAKITRLLRSAFHHDVQSGIRATWEKHLATLRNHDVYVLVMVDRAGIPRPKPQVRQNPRSAMSPKMLKMLIGRSPDIAAGLITLSGFVYFFVLHTPWHRGGPPILGNLAENLIPSEKLRGIFLLSWIGSMLWLFVRFKDLRG